MERISWSDFEKVDIRVGTILEIHDFPEARKSAYKLLIDFGPLGLKKSSAQITVHYTKEDLFNKQVIAVVNFPPKQIGNFLSEVLVTGYEDENLNIVLVHPERQVPNGNKLL